MKRIGIFSTIILAAIFLTAAGVSAQEPPRSGPGAPGRPALDCEIQRAVQEAYERGFKQGFREGFHAHKETLFEGRRGESFRHRGPMEGPPADFRGPGPKGEARQRGDFRHDGPPGPQRFHGPPADFRGPGPQGERSGGGGFGGGQGQRAFQGEFRGPGPRGEGPERGEFRRGSPRGERPERGEFRPAGPPQRGPKGDRPPKGDGPGPDEMAPPPGE